MRMEYWERSRRKKEVENGAKEERKREMGKGGKGNGEDLERDEIEGGRRV